MSCIGEEVARAEDSMLSAHHRTKERKESRYEEAREALVAEFMQAVNLPLLTTVHTPTDRNPFQRTAFMEEFFDRLTWGEKALNLQARAIAVLARHDPELVKELAQMHADAYADEVQS